MNLLTETLGAITCSGHTPEDIVFIGSRDSGHCCTWEEFKILADQEYDSGFGSQDVARDLEIVFKDKQTMWRSEYDGSEWWSYSVPFKMPKEKKPIRTLFCGMWSYLADQDERDE